MWLDSYVIYMSLYMSLSHQIYNHTRYIFIHNDTLFI